MAGSDENNPGVIGPGNIQGSKTTPKGCIYILISIWFKNDVFLKLLKP